MGELRLTTRDEDGNYHVQKIEGVLEIEVKDIEKLAGLKQHPTVNARPEPGVGGRIAAAFAAVALVCGIFAVSALEDANKATREQTEAIKAQTAAIKALAPPRQP